MAVGKLARSLSLRLLLPALLWIAGTLVVGGFVLVGAFRDYVVTDFDARMEQILGHMVGASDLEYGMIRFTRPIADQRFSEPYSGWYWQVSARGEAPFRSRSLWDRALDPRWDLEANSPRIVEQDGPANQPLRVMMRDVRLPDAEGVYRFLVAGDTDQIRRDIEGFGRLIVSALGFLGAGLVLAVLLQIWVGLRPLAAVRAGLARIRSGRARRLEGTFPSELDPLVDELNALIGHNERVLERARTHVANLAHALKTPISVLQNEARGRKDALAESVRSQTAAMRRQIDHHLKRARVAGGGGIVGSACAIDKPIADLMRAMAKIHAGRDLAFETDLAAGLRFRGEAQDLSEMVGNLLDNACKWARSRVRVSARSVPGGERPMLEIRVEDDGPGVSEAERESLFERGSRLDQSKPGSGLGLAIVRDVATLAGGAVRLEPSPLGGLAAVLQLPAAEA